LLEVHRAFCNTSRLVTRACCSPPKVQSRPAKIAMPSQPPPYPNKDDLFTIMPLISILELLVVLLYLGHFSGCFFYLLSTPPYQTAGRGP
jgi:hypothetical protein